MQISIANSITSVALMRSDASGAYDTVISIDIGSETGTLELAVAEPAAYAGTYPIDLTALASAPVLLRAAPAPTGTQALGETLTGRPALWAIAAGETIEIERRWWKGNGPLLDQGGHPPLNLLYECEWHSDAQEPFRIDERARYVTDPVTAWPVGGGWQLGDETTPPDPSPFLSGSFVDPATEALWICTPYTTPHGLLEIDLTTTPVRSLERVMSFETINPAPTPLSRFRRNSDAENEQGYLQIRNSAIWHMTPRGCFLHTLDDPVIDLNNRSEMTIIVALMITQPLTGEHAIMSGNFTGGWGPQLRLLPETGPSGGARVTMKVNGASSTVQVSDWWGSVVGTPTRENPAVLVLGGRRKDDVTSLWLNGARIGEAGPDNIGQTFATTDYRYTMMGTVTGSSDFDDQNGYQTGAFLAMYGLSDSEMTAVMGHIARAVGGTT